MFKGYFVIFTYHLKGLFRNFKFHLFKFFHMMEDVILQISSHLFLKLDQSNNIHLLKSIIFKWIVCGWEDCLD